MDIPRLSPRVNPDAADRPDQPVTPPPGPAGPVLKQREVHDSSLSVPNAEEESEQLSLSAPVVRSQTAGAPGKSPTQPPEGRYNAAGKFHYKDGNGEVDYDIVATIKGLAYGQLADITTYPEMVRYEFFDCLMREGYRPDIRASF